MRILHSGFKAQDKGDQKSWFMIFTLNDLAPNPANVNPGQIEASSTEVTLNSSYCWKCALIQDLE